MFQDVSHPRHICLSDAWHVNNKTHVAQQFDEISFEIGLCRQNISITQMEEENYTFYADTLYIIRDDVCTVHRRDNNNYYFNGREYYELR